MNEELEKDPMDVLNEAKAEYAKTLKAGYPDYLKELADHQIKYQKDGDRTDEDVNPLWQSEWEGFIKFDQDWDWGYLINLILYKLKKMKAWYSRFGMTSDENRATITAQIDEAIRLADYAMDTDFNEDAMNWSKGHQYHWVEIREYDGHILHNGKVIHVTKPEKEDPNDIFSCHLLNNKEADDWCAANGHKAYKDVIYSYCSKWDNIINRWIWMYKLKKAAKAEQKAYNAFFLYVSEHFREWCD